MPAKVESRDGYGWSVGESTVIASDQHGTYISFGTTASHRATKTINVDHTRHGLQFISHAFRVYAVAGNFTLTVTPANMLPTPTTAAFTVAVVSGSYSDVVIEGWANDTDVTLLFQSSSDSDRGKIYITQESGY